MASPEARAMIPRTRALFVSDFMGDIDALCSKRSPKPQIAVCGAFCCKFWTLTEEAFPFQGRAIFRKHGRDAWNTKRAKANDLRDRYLERLSPNGVITLESPRAKSTGWQFATHLTDAPVQQALLWLYRAMEGGGR